MSEPCAQCDNQPCVFDEFREDFIETRAWSCLKDALLDDACDVNNTDTNCNLRKRLFCKFAMWNGTMTTPPTPHPTCVVKGVRLLYPSEQYMGFKRTRNEVDNTAVDIDGKKIKGTEWVRNDEGKIMKLSFYIKTQRRG